MKLLLSAFSVLCFLCGGSEVRSQSLSELNFLPAALHFPATLIGQVSDPLSLTVQPDQVGGLHVRLGDPSHFEIVKDGCTAEPLQVGRTCTISVVFSPDQFGHYNSSLVFLDNQGQILDFVPLQGLGVDGSFIPSATDSPMPTQVLLSAQDLEFDNVDLFVSSPLQSLTVSNVGNEELHLKPITVGGDDPASFSVVETCSLGPIAPGTTCSIGAIFTPMEAGSLQGALAVAGNAEGSPFVIRLQGGGGPPPPPPSSGGCSLSGLPATATALGIFTAAFSLLVLRLRRRLK